MNKRWSPAFLLLLGALMVVGTACSSQAGVSATSIILSPPSNSEFREDEVVTINSVSTDPAGIQRVELVVDGIVVRSDLSPMPQSSFNVIQTWTAKSGPHTILVRAVNSQNQVNEAAAINISVAPSVSVVQPTATTEASRVCTNNANFVTDVTVPDGTVLAPKQTFNKIWRIRNTGTCAWGGGEELVFVRGETMSEVRTVAVPPTAPGSTADLLVAMTTPAAAGTHVGEWRIKNNAGTFFGSTLRVVVNVPSPISASCPFMPWIESFTVSPTTIQPGQSATLRWGRVLGAERAEIDNDIGGVPAPGNITINPATTKTFTLTATCGFKVTTAQVTLVVLAPTPIPPTPTPIPSTPTATRVP